MPPQPRPFSGFDDHCGSWIADFVNTVAKAHDPLATTQRGSHPGLGAVRRADLGEPFQPGPRHPAVPGPCLSPCRRSTPTTRVTIQSVRPIVIARLIP